MDSSLRVGLSAIPSAISRLGSAPRTGVVFLGTGMGQISTSSVPKTWPIYSLAIGHSQGATWIKNLELMSQATGGKFYQKITDVTINYIKGHLCILSTPKLPPPPPKKVSCPYDIDVVDGTFSNWVNHKGFTLAPSVTDYTEEGFVMKWKNIGKTVVDGKKCLVEGQKLKFASKSSQFSLENAQLTFHYPKFTTK
ncbi:hypothetical protein GEMRC1_003474 [Eukaryota sp. GEM-RC1]